MYVGNRRDTIDFDLPSRAQSGPVPPIKILPG